jgi:hypothetical protein
MKLKVLIAFCGATAVLAQEDEVEAAPPIVELEEVEEAEEIEEVTPEEPAD